MQSNAGWKDGFFNFFVPFLNGMGGFNIMNDGESPYTMDASLCELDLKASRPNITSDIQDCISQAGDVDAIVVGSSSSNNDIKQVAESLKIPNLHCSGGNPVQWTATTPHAFGMHLPFPWYSRGPIRRAAVQGLRRILIIRDYDWGFPRTSAVAAAEWSLEASMTVIGPSLAWCRQWANMTQTCRIVNDACRCGDQAEFDALGYKYQVATMPTFYEVSESAVVEVGIDPRSEVVSPALVAFLEGIIEDVRRQGQDPDMVVNWLTSARSGLVAMRQQRLAFQMYFGGPNVPGTSWSGYESYWQNGTAALGSADALYNIGGGQWHHGDSAKTLPFPAVKRPAWTPKVCNITGWLCSEVLGHKAMVSCTSGVQVQNPVSQTDHGDLRSAAARVPLRLHGCTASFRYGSACHTSGLGMQSPLTGMPKPPRNAIF